ncbi:MAG: hypothetical protein M1818_004063 [Claussenomyces sp. TS43310]|nr:MAG: hypothetical protein M1818_004063 [Claussenomyces sp. TS43310]
MKQLHPEAKENGEDEYEWYKKSCNGNSEEKMTMHTTFVVPTYGVSAGISHKFGGKIANILDTHRIIQHFREKGR